jgi:nucleoside-diphosphate-sugar epimerase
MKTLLLGGTGFLGYDFYRTAIRNGTIETDQLHVYSGSPGSLPNLARHPARILHAPINTLADRPVPEGVDYVVNYAHPFGIREGMSTSAQIDALSGFIVRVLKRNPTCRLVHVSTMSVYEPFAPEKRFPEDSPLRPPRKDAYAKAKVRMEGQLRGLIESSRMLILRPTVVYGPYCRPWTDRLLAMFHEGGTVRCGALKGRIQPIWGRDVTRFVLDRMKKFESGVFNLAGDEEMTWLDLVRFMGRVVGRGGVEVDPDLKSPTWAMSVKALLRDGLRALLTSPNLKPAALPLAEAMPAAWLTAAKERLNRLKPIPMPPDPVEGVVGPTGAFFDADRLVAIDKFKTGFPEFKLTSLASTKDTLTSYYRHRFDEPTPESLSA